MSNYREHKSFDSDRGNTLKVHITETLTTRMWVADTELGRSWPFLPKIQMMKRFPPPVKMPETGGKQTTEFSKFLYGMSGETMV